MISTLHRTALTAVLLVACQTGTPRSDRETTEREGEATAAGAGRGALPLRATPATPMMMMVSGPPAPPLADDADAVVAPPWSLTASDGSGLELTRVDAKAVVQGPLALTELHLYFRNPEDREREGTFAITLPSGAAISRFAMEDGGQWKEAEVVEKAVARRAYDDFLHMRQDPALLEKAAGNQFNAKVYPIDALAEKHLVIAFSQELVGRAYTLPLRGLPKVAQVDVALTATDLRNAPQTQTLAERDWKPDRDFVATTPETAAAVTSGTLVAGALAFTDAAAPAAPEPPTELTVLVDTSASRALGYDGYVKSVRALIRELRSYGDGLALQVIAFDQDTQPIYDGAIWRYGDAEDDRLRARGAAGASDLGQALAALTAPKRRVVVITDAVVTAGAETPALLAAVAKLPIDRLDVVLAGGLRDERLAGSLVRAGLPKAGDVHDLDLGVEGVAAGLGEPVVTDVAIEVPGALWSYPKHLPAARPGSALMVYAKLAQPSTKLTVVIGGVSRTVTPADATPALIERAVAGAEIEDLENQLAKAEGDAAKALRETIAKMSVASRVLSSQTSMLVLESEEDYERYDIARNALADILVIGPSGIEVEKRAAVAPPPPPAPPPTPTPKDEAEVAAEAELLARRQAVERLQSLQRRDVSSGFDDTDVSGGLLGDEPGEMTGGFGYGRSGSGPGGGGSGWGTIGTGRYGTIGHGSGTGSGYGVGGGRGGMRGDVADAPDVRIGQPTMTGNLDKATVRRYIRRNIAKIKYCYEKQLLAQPGLEGTVTARWQITATGAVTGAAASGLDPDVDRCIAGVIAAIAFPRPTSGAVEVSAYPFVFAKTGGALPEPEPDPAPVSDAPEEPEEEYIDESEYGYEGDDSEEEEDKGGPALTGKLAQVMKALKSRKVADAYKLAKAWHDDAPGDVLALVALGEVLEAQGKDADAARIYGSIIDLFPGRADQRRMAGQRLERLGKRTRALVIDTYRRAAEDRPDHVTGHRLLAYARVRAGEHQAAFDAILAGLALGDHTETIGEDAAMIGAALIANGGDAADVNKKLAEHDLEPITTPSTRFIMYWETDANDVDFHIRDARRGHAWYSKPRLRSGGRLYEDITDGYGPECFAIQGKPTAAPYRLSINYYEQGPMGYGMGLLQIQVFDGKAFTFQDRPYVIMTDHAFVDLGTYR